MGTIWRGTVEDRFNRLDEQHRRCEGNGCRCTRSATQMVWVIPAAQHANPFIAATEKTVCQFHRKEFEQSASWKCIRTHRMPPKFTIEQLRAMPQWWRKDEAQAA